MINGVQPALAGLDMNMPGFVGYGVGDQVRLLAASFACVSTANNI
jgi:hypothetical protein